MPFIPVPGVVQSTLFYEGSGGVFAQNRFYWAAETVPTETDLTEIDDALYDVFVAQIPDVMSSFWQLNGMTHRAMNEAEGLQLVSAQAFPVVGTSVSSDMEAAQVCYTVTLNTGLVGRSARGRIYGVGIADSFADGSRLTTSAQGFLQTAWGEVFHAMEVAGHSGQVVSFETGGVFRAEGRPLPILSVNVRFPLATQRRRLT